MAAHSGRGHAPFRFDAYPVDGPRGVTQAFGARPEVYQQYGFPAHEGADLRAALGAAVRSVAAGTVAKLTTTGNYGNRIDVRHDGGYTTTYAHLDRVAALAVGAAVTAGQVIGYAGSSGNSTGVHLHLGLKRDGYTYTSPGGVVWPSNIHDPSGFLAPFLSSSGIDMATYFFPATGDFGDIAILKNNWGAADERQQLQRQGDLSYVTKNSQWERRRFDVSGVYLEMDTSPGNEEYYKVEGQWLPRSWKPGDSFTRTERVSFFAKMNCRPSKSPYTTISTISFDKLIPEWTSLAGVKLSNVIELSWILKGVVEERYWYAPGLGLCQWQNRAGRHSWIVERIPLGRQQNNVREVIGCSSAALPAQ